MIENKTYVVAAGTLLTEVTKELNKMGKENWETCGVLKNGDGEVIFFLKREVEVKRKKKQTLNKKEVR